MHLNDALDLLFRDAVSVVELFQTYKCLRQSFFSNAMAAPDCSCSVRVVDVYPYRMQSDVPELLLLRRANNVSYAGAWRMVGGKIESEETAWQAALRELREETGMTPGRFWTIPSLNQFYEWQHDRVNLIPAFAAEVDGRPVLNHEHDTFEWLSVEDATRRLHWPEQQRLVHLLISMLDRGVPKALIIPVDE